MVKKEVNEGTNRNTKQWLTVTEVNPAYDGAQILQPHS